MAKKNFSRRAKIPKRVLYWIEQDEYENHFDYLIFGKGLQAIIDEETLFPEVAQRTLM